MARRPKRNEHDNHERWMVSYADFITLLFAFFVVMYGISSVNEGKYKVFSIAVNDAFGSKSAQPGEGTVRLNEQEIYFKSLVDRRNARLAEQQRKQNERMQILLQTLSANLDNFVRQGVMHLSQSNRGVVIDINASVLFNPAEAELQAEAIKNLSEIARTLVDGDQMVEVEGYTDNLPIKTAQFPSNWELSSARASSVVRLFIEQGISPTRLTAVGVADNRPVESNDTPEGRARNRRVTVTILAPELERTVPVTGQ